MLEHLKAVVPDTQILLSLEPEELAATLLFILRQHGGNSFSFLGMEGELSAASAGPPLYEHSERAQVGLALREAAAWLEAQGLVIPAEGYNGSIGWRVLSRRAWKFQSRQEFASYASARRLQIDALHERIRRPVWAAFMRNEFDVAVFLAMKAVEVAVREGAGLDAGDVGVKLIRKAFDVENGPLTDMTSEKSERQARSDLFAGAIGSYKNPHSHRNVDLSDPIEASEIVMMANHLLRIVDSRL